MNPNEKERIRVKRMMHSINGDVEIADAKSTKGALGWCVGGYAKNRGWEVFRILWRVWVKPRFT
jgi:hypothetical protein